MISFRFHVVSIVAVFLALAVGIVVGSTVIDRAIVEGLRSRVDDVSANLDERQAANDRLRERVDLLEEWAVDVGPIAVEGRLEDTITVIVTDRGVDREPVDRTIDLLGQAGSTVRGVLTIDEAWRLDDEERRSALALVTGQDDGEPATALRERASRLLVNDLASEVEVVGDDTGAVDEIMALELVDYEPLSDIVATGPRQVLFVVVSGPESDLGSSAHTEHFALAAIEHAGGAVVAEVHVQQDDGPDRADSLAAILGSPTLSAQITTVDDLDLAPGPVTTVLALVAAQAGEVGHYGVGDGAQLMAPLPPAPS